MKFRQFLISAVGLRIPLRSTSFGRQALSPTYTLICIIFTFCTNLLFAQPMNVSLQMKLLQAITTSEERGDEIYLLITEKRNISKCNDYILPNNKNNFWHLTSGDSIKDITIWQGTLVPDEAIAITIDILEKDFAILDFDEHLQAFTLSLSELEGNLQPNWQVNKDTVVGPYYEMTDEGVVTTFQWQDQLSSYMIKFLIITLEA